MNFDSEQININALLLSLINLKIKQTHILLHQVKNDNVVLSAKCLKST